MSQESTARRCPVRCVNCGEILAASVQQDGTIVPIGVENDGTCGNAEFRVLEGGGSVAVEGHASTAGDDPAKGTDDASPAANEP